VDRHARDRFNTVKVQFYSASAGTSNLDYGTLIVEEWY
jgi:hypothetical protein